MVVLSVDLVKEIIKTNFNRYFKCLDIVDCVIANREGVTIKYLMDCRKKYRDPFDKFRGRLCGEVTWVLKLLKAEGVIEKYNGKMWVILE